MCHPTWLLSRKFGTVWYHPASSKLWYLTALSFVNFHEKLTGTSFALCACEASFVRLAVCLASSTLFASTRPVFADGPFFSGRFCWLCVLYRTVRDVGPDNPQCWRGRSAGAGRTVREASADGPPLLAGRSVRACVLCFLVRFLPSFFVLPRVLQGIVPRTRG
jgi:hypothetical protein